MTAEAKRLRIAAVLSRDPEGGHIKGGRLRTLSSVLAGLSKAGEVFRLRQFNAMEIRKVSIFAELTITLLRSWLRGQSLPLQCVLYAARSEQRRVLTNIRAISPHIIYIDMIRLAPIIPLLRKEFPDARIIFDMDDLISRRFELIGRSKASVSLGYIDSLLPKMLAKTLALRNISQWLANYEARTIRRVELEVIQNCDVVVLVSTLETKLLAERLGQRSNDRKKLITIQPPVDVAASEVKDILQPVHFVFVGTDRLLQNAKTIDWLIDVWEHQRPNTTLSIVGQQIRPNRDVPGIRWLGFVDNLAEVYDERSVILAPAFIGGGVKTKILEAFGFGRSAVGNATSFEGIEIANYPLNLDEIEICKLIADPTAYFQRMNLAAVLGWRYVTEKGGYPQHQESWRTLALKADGL